MKTFSPHKLVLFKMKDCAPCLNASMTLDKVIHKHPEFVPYSSQLWKENHPSLVATYELELFPTLIILNSDLDEINRITGSKNLTEDFWWKILTSIHHSETQ